MSVGKEDTHHEVGNAFKNIGPLGPPNTIAFTDPANAGLVSFLSKTHSVTQFVGKRGPCLCFVTELDNGLGDGTEVPREERGTRNAATLSGDNSKPTITALKNPDGTGLTIVSGGGQKPTIQLALGDGSSSVTIMPGYIAMQTGGVELTVDQKRNMVWATGIRVMEANVG